MSRKKTSPIWLMPTTELQSLVEKSASIRDVLRHFSIQNKGGNFRTLYARLDAEGIDRSKFKGNFGKGRIKPTIPLESLLRKDSLYNRTNLKRRLLKDGLLTEQCSICKLLPVWNDKPLKLILDHINGTSDDNRLENLRLLCPNCNSQTETFAGRNRRISDNCKNCGVAVRKHRKYCVECRKTRIARRKVLRPTKEQLKKMLWEKPTKQIAKEYGVSDSAVSKWAKQYELQKPGRGYWQKLK